MQLTNPEIEQLNNFEGFFRFKPTWALKKYLSCDNKIILLIYGNQGGKTSGTAYQYVLRILGLHPVAKKNVVYYECKNDHCFAPFKVNEAKICTVCGEELKIHERTSRTFRFCSATLPGQTTVGDNDGGTSEVKNTQYPEFKKWLPPFLIKKDITARNPAIIIKDIYGGPDIVAEFVSYNQSTQSTAGVQRLSIWCDESPDYDFYEEQIPRLIAEDGDMIFTYTPVDRSSWLFDMFYEKAQVYYRSKDIVDYLATSGEKHEMEEKVESPYDIAVIMAATDENPTLRTEVIDAMFHHIDDPDAIAIRRYGIFKQLSGRIFKDFDYNVHVIDRNKYFPDGIPSNWTHARGIDFHPQTPWACGMATLSPQNELFIWGEWNPSPEKFTVREIARELAIREEDKRFKLNLIDPLAKAVKKNLSGNITVLDDLNDEFRRLAKEGLCSRAYWRTWNTKGEKGRDAIRERLKNSLEVKEPFKNKVRKDGVEVYLPTIWILDNCKMSAQYMKNWRWEEWADAKAKLTKEEKNKPEQKWSHFNMVWEALLKETAFRPSRYEMAATDKNYQYFRR